MKNNSGVPVTFPIHIIKKTHEFQMTYIYGEIVGKKIAVLG